MADVASSRVRELKPQDMPAMVHRGVASSRVRELKLSLIIYVR